MGEKTSKYILSESTQEICSQKFKHTSRKGLYGRNKLQTTSCLKVHKIFAPQISSILVGRVSTKLVQNIVKSQIVDFWPFVCLFVCLFLFVVLFWAFNMGVNGEI